MVKGERSSLISGKHTKMKIEILCTEHIKPSSPTPSQFQEFQLSFIDERIPHHYIPIILYYSLIKHQNINRSRISNLLKKSLSNALVKFYPLAGRRKAQSSIDCGNQGILFVEAISSGMISHIVESVGNEALDNLIPYKSNGNVSNAEEQLAVQLTFFQCGGIALGICISHRIADASTLSSFIKFWAATARVDDQINALSPVFNPASLFPAQNTPDFKPNARSPSVQPPLAKLVTKRFVFSASVIDSLKLKVMKNSSIAKPTRIEVVSAYLWKHCLLAKGRDKSVAFLPVNLRGRIPALTEQSFGNLFQMTSAMDNGETDDWMHLVEKLRDAFGKINSQYIKQLVGEKGFELAKENFMEISKLMAMGDVEVIRFSIYCRFPFHEADFGWGKPVWVSSASFGNKDSVLLFDSVQSKGGIEAWIVMADKDMESLEQDIELRNFTSSLFW